MTVLRSLVLCWLVVGLVGSVSSAHAEEEHLSKTVVETLTIPSTDREVDLALTCFADGRTSAELTIPPTYLKPITVRRSTAYALTFTFEPPSGAAPEPVSNGEASKTSMVFVGSALYEQKKDQPSEYFLIPTGEIANPYIRNGAMSGLTPQKQDAFLQSLARANKLTIVMTGDDEAKRRSATFEVMPFRAPLLKLRAACE